MQALLQKYFSGVIKRTHNIRGGQMSAVPVYLYVLLVLFGIILAVMWLFVPFAVFRQARLQQAMLNELQAMRRENAQAAERAASALSAD
jgi:hypothetical protein